MSHLLWSLTPGSRLMMWWWRSGKVIRGVSSTGIVVRWRWFERGGATAHRPWRWLHQALCGAQYTRRHNVRPPARPARPPCRRPRQAAWRREVRQPGGGGVVRRMSFREKSVCFHFAASPPHAILPSHSHVFSCCNVKAHVECYSSSEP